MWDEVAERLAERFRVVVYDVRGAGASSAPSDPLDYGLDVLMGDLEAVLDGVGRRARAPGVGHDWGSVQGWEAVIGDRVRRRIASFTSNIRSGPAAPGAVGAGGRPVPARAGWRRSSGRRGGASTSRC